MNRDQTPSGEPTLPDGPGKKAGPAGGPVPPPSPFDWPPMPDPWPAPPALVALSAAISVDPTEISAITQNKQFPERTNVYLRGGGTAHLIVHRPLVEVLDVVAHAYTGDPGP